jgi:uncharacterized protein
MDASSGWCKGCYRSIEEIVAWGQSDNAYKRQVWARLEERRNKAEAKL